MEITLLAGDGRASAPYRYRLTLTNEGAADWCGMVKVTLQVEAKDARFFLPGYLYGTNNGFSEYNPRLIKQFQRLGSASKGTPYSEAWATRSDQLTHPVAAVFSAGKFLAISGKPFFDEAGGAPRFNGFTCSQENGASVGYTLGYRYSPGNYTRPHEFERYPACSEGNVQLKQGQTAVFHFEVFGFESENESALGRILEQVYTDYHVPPRNGSASREAAEEIAAAVFNSAYSRKLKTYGLIQRKPLGDTAPALDQYEMAPAQPEVYNTVYEGLISWTNGSVIAVPLLQASYRLGKSEYREQALDVIQNIIANSRNPRNGIPYCTQIEGTWTNKGWWTVWVESENRQAEHSSYIVGQALYYIVRACETERDHYATSHSDWISFADEVLTVLAKTQDSAGAFPRFWAESSIEGSEYDAFSGCWVAAAMAVFQRFTGNDKFAPAVAKAEAHYFKQVETMVCAKTPLDVADAPDAEGILAYVRMVAILHAETGDPRWLARLRTALDYELSFKFCYNVPVIPLPLGGTGWSSCGGTITSVCNAVVHCMSSAILDELHYYWSQTREPYYRERLKDTLLWGLQTYNRRDNEFYFGKKGWSTEYFSQADRHVLDIRLPDATRSNLWFAYHPWAPSSILEGLLGRLWDSEIK
ncbi:hypothetical protein [Nibricoccus sp. IMCC34717]|uniref:hypothetical protein n=1 Tax=Nibricoccus sp. IMCC34717 TaxID=3034021 RepID=UPI00384F37BC